MAKLISEYLENWDLWEPPVNPETKLHIPTMWELAEQARELNGGNIRIILLDLETYFYVLVGNIGLDFALDVYATTDEVFYDDMLYFFDRQEVRP